MAIASRRVRVTCWILLVAATAVALLVRIRFLEFPLERDEGEYAYAGQLLLRGVAPYQFVYNMKFPGTYLAYAGLMAVFGQSTAGIHLGLLIVNLATVVCVFVIGRQLASIEAGLLAASFYAVLSLSPWLAGLCGHATHFVVLPMLVGAAILLRRTGGILRTAIAGVMFGIALAMKQPGALFLPFGCAAIVTLSRRDAASWKTIAARLATFISGAAAPLLLMVALLAIAGVLARFKYWAVDYARTYETLISPLEGMRLFLPRFPQIIGADWLIWAVAAVGAVAATFVRTLWPNRTIMFALLICSIAAVCPGFYFREHYFILLLPALALAAAVTLIRCAKSRMSQFAIIGFAIAAIAWPLISDRDMLFRLAPDTVARSLYWPSPFPEALRVSDFVRERSTPADTIAVLGSEPEIFFYTNRRSATGYIYTYALMEPQSRASEMQREMIAEIERAQPKFLIVIGIDSSWLRRPHSDQTIFQWSNDYCAANYNIVGLVNLISPDRADFFLPFDPASHETPAANYIIVYERRSAALP